MIGQRTWQLEQSPRAAAVAALRRGLELGMTHLDSAEMYGTRAADRLPTEWVACERFAPPKPVPQRCPASIRLPS
ncbi:MAG TPA: hypothetical protein VEB21_08795 [Terriglobales bacterium]|nr:hypothetical protein [Terriglobales bacterium]